jgi:beta-galactosidase
MLRKAALLLLFAVGTALLCLAAPPAVHHQFAVAGDQFTLDGKPFQILSGDMHYPRVPRQDWHARMKMLRALGLNTLTTYVFWDLHEPRQGVWNFAGNLDLAAYLQAAQDEGLFVILRPGPYVCSEWDLGGLPPWLLADESMKIRSRDPKFLAAAARYIKKVGEIAAPFQVTRGGNVIMVQVENEYGSYGADHDYMRAIQQILRDSGFDVIETTSDGSSASQLAGGTLPDALSVINFSASDDPAAQFASFAKFRTGVPRMVGEFWTGWFDAWGERHHRTRPEVEAKNLDWLLSQGISVNLYMAHGGSTFGPMAGANLDQSYTPDISNYDYDAPIDEAGRVTPKFDALRAVLAKYQHGAKLPDPPEHGRVIALDPLVFHAIAPLEKTLGTMVRSADPVSMEALDQSYGYVLYRHRITASVSGTLEIAAAHDYALVSQRGKLLGVLDRRRNETKLEVQLDPGAPLEILVEAQGRVNFGPHLVDDRKGIVGAVKLNGEELKGWEMYSIPVDRPASGHYKSRKAKGPAYYRATFNLNPLGDTFLDLRGWGKGYVWVNGHNLGRYWGVGPQQSLFCPGVWLKLLNNEIVVLDLDPNAARTLRGSLNAIWATPDK